MRMLSDAFKWRLLPCVCIIVSTTVAWAQTNSIERTFPQSRAAIEKALKAMQVNMAGRLPVLETFAKPGEYPLNRYQRGYYQATAEVVNEVYGKTVMNRWLLRPNQGRSNGVVFGSLSVAFGIPAAHLERAD